MTRSVANLVREVAADLRKAGVGDTPQLDAELVVGHVLGLDRVGLRTRGDDVVEPAHEARVAQLVARRRTGEPVAYLLGSAWFYGREFLVDRRVLVPRPETEQLVDLALQHLERRIAVDAASGDLPLVVVDACTGSGCVAISIAAEAARRWPAHAVRVVGTDLSGEALELAAENARRLAPSVELREGDLLAPVADLAGQCVAVVANPPYVDDVDDPGLDAGVRDHEPHVALFAPPGGAATLVGRLAAQAIGLLVPGGLVAIEHGIGQRDDLVGALRTAGFDAVEGRDDLAGIDRVALGRRPAKERSACSS